MSKLGTFGGSTKEIKAKHLEGGASPQSDAIEEAQQGTWPTPEGSPASSQQVMPGVRAFSHNLTFSSTDSNTVAWTSGTIYTADGTSYSIDAGNTGNISALNFIYLDLDTSETVLQKSTTYSDGVGNRKILIAVAENVSDATKYAKFFVFGGNGGLGGTWITADMIVAGTITANEITVTQLSAISANLGSITAGTIVLSSSGYIRAGQTDYDTGTGFWLGISGATPKFSIGNSAGRKLTWDGSALSVDGVLTAAAGSSIGSAALNLADRGWIQTCVFSVTDLNTISWGAGSFIAADGTTYSIGAGNTGNMAARTYIYLDIAVSTTAYQVTTTASTAVGAGKVMIGTAVNGTDEAEFELFVAGPGGSNINASQIVAGSITANEIAASTITAGKLSVSQLSAITANMGDITSGTMAIGSGNNILKFNSTDGLFIGNATFASAPFRVSIAGALTATSATITGAIDANSGTIGALTVDGALVIGTGGSIESDDYVAGTTGFKLDATGGLEVNTGVISGDIVGPAARSRYEWYFHESIGGYCGLTTSGTVTHSAVGSVTFGANSYIAKIGVGSVGYIYASQNPIIEFKFTTGADTTAGFTIGLANSTTLSTPASNPTVGIFINVSTTNGACTFYTRSSGEETTSLGDFESTTHVIRFVFNGTTSVKCYKDGTLVATHTTHIHDGPYLVIAGDVGGANPLTMKYMWVEFDAP